MSNTSLPEDRIPVIVGVGEIVDRPKDIAAGLEPLTLLEQALRRAEADSGAKLLGELGSLDVVNFLSWRYRDPEKLLAERLGAKPAHCYYGPVGGESPIRYLHEAAQRIARGECSVAAVCGAEAQSTATKAERGGITLPWTPFANDVEEPKRGAAFQKPMAVKLGVFRPITVYPLYEVRDLGALGPDPARGVGGVRQAVVDLFEGGVGKSELVAEEALCAGRDHDADGGKPADRLALHQADGGQSDRQHGRRDADDVAGKSPRGRRARGSPGLSSGAARRRKSRATIWCATSSIESHPQNAVLKAVMDLVEGDGKKFDAIELYSCFPCVPKMARRTLGLGPDVQPTVTGGLTFFGAPLNTYMTHAACAMVRSCANAASSACSTARAVSSPSITALVLSREAPKQALKQDTSVQAEADRGQGRGAGVRHRSLRQGQGRELYRDLQRQGRSRARRGDDAHGARCPRAGAGAGQRCRDAGASAATWTARRWERWAIS